MSFLDPREGWWERGKLSGPEGERHSGGTLTRGHGSRRMPASRLLLPLMPLLTRAAVLWLILKVALLAIGAAAEAMGAPSPESPFGIVVLTGVLGTVDIARRGERMLWANLGYAPAVTAGLFVLAALVGEVAWAML